MKKIVYIAAIEMLESDGVCRKILSQINALNSFGFDVTFCYLHKDGYAIERNGVAKVYRMKFKYLFFYRLVSHLSEGSFDLLYVRNPSRFHYPCFSHLAKKVKGRLLLELPTYPIEDDASRIKGILGNLFFVIFWGALKVNIDKIYYMGKGSGLIWGLPAEEISNGVELESIPINPQSSYNNIDIIAIARMEEWHGYDRLIKSISQLSNKSGVHLHIVGDNEPCLSHLKGLVSALDLFESVTFHGALHGADLSRLFARCNLAVDALGRHRVGHSYNSSIKSKEYTARGIPFIKSHLDKDFYDTDFVFNVKPNDDAFDLEEVINWLRKENFNPEYIRKFAKDNLSWAKKMDFILKEVD